MELMALAGDLVGGALTLAKEIGKGGGGSPDEPTVCMALVPFGLAVLVAGASSLRRKLAAARQRLPAGA